MKTKSLAIGPNIEVFGQELFNKELPISGFKHLCVQTICASIIVDRPVILNNVPNILDTQILSQIINLSGGSAIYLNNQLYFNFDNINGIPIPPHLSQQIHGSLYLIPAFLARFGKVEFSEAGGCAIGEKENKMSRPVDQILSVAEIFGAKFKQVDGAIHGHSDGFHACQVDILDYSTSKEYINGPKVSGATKAAILCALGVDKGESVIHNPYLKPDVVELLKFVQNCGYEVFWDDQHIKISKQEKINDDELVEFTIGPCLIEVITYITLGIHLKIPITLVNIEIPKVKDGLKAELALLKQMGIKIEWGKDSLFVPVPEKIHPVDIQISPISIYSDSQPFFALMLTHAEGTSHLEDSVWTNRFQYIDGLNKLGAKIIRKKNGICIHPAKLHKSGKILLATDLRSAAVQIIAALGIKGKSRIEQIHHLNRGYERLLSNLEYLGANLRIGK